MKIGYFVRKIHEKCQEIGTKICNFEQKLCSDTFESKSVRCSFTHSFCQILVFPFLWVEAGCLRLPPSLPSPCLHLEGMEFTSTHPPGIPLLPFGGRGVCFYPLTLSSRCLHVSRERKFITLFPCEERGVHACLSSLSSLYLNFINI